MLESILRPTYQTYIVNPNLWWARKYSPKTITSTACITGVLAGLSLAFGSSLLATIFLLLSGFLDTLDGTVARIENKTSDIGSILDIVSDRIVELALMCGLFAIDPHNRSGFVLAMLGSCYLCITSFLVVAIFASNESSKGFHYSRGLMERAEAFIFFILMIWFPSGFNVFAVTFSSLVLLTSYLHIKKFIQFSNVMHTH